MTNSGAAVTSTPYFSDTELQDVLDGQVTFIRNERMPWLSETDTSGVPVYYECKGPYRDIEGTASGTAYWTLKTSTGALITSGFTQDGINGLIRFTADQGGTAYYLTARSYDLNAAAADVLMQRAAYFSDWYSFAGDGQKFERQQAYEQSIKMIEVFRARTGQNIQRGGMQSNVFLRTDINRSV
jgi:hypothetical protein